MNLPYVPMSDAPTFVPNEGQVKALEALERWVKGEGPQDITLTGAAGTGKTSVLQLVKPMLSAAHGSPLWTAMTGKAATRMQAAAKVDASTLHATLYEPPTTDGKSKSLKFSAMRDPEGTHLIIDESSMITPPIVRDIKNWMRMGIRVCYVGDGYQLPPVLTKEEIKEAKEAGIDLQNDFSIFAQVPGVELTKVMRTGDVILDAATALRERGTMPVGKPGSAYELIRCPDPSGRAVADYLNDPVDHGLITWTNKTRMGANKVIRKHLGIETEELQVGEPILVCKNSLGGAVLNGEVYKIAEITPSFDLGNIGASIPTLTIRTECGRYIHACGHAFDGSTPYFADYQDWKAYRQDINTRRIPEPIPITYGHVLTAHKAQGSEYRRVTVFLPKRDTSVPHFQAMTTLPNGQKVPFARRFLYTAITRAKSKLTLMMGT